MEIENSGVISTFQKMHEDGCFVIPNPWDVGTALYLQHIGFKALATTSAGVSFSLGFPDVVSVISRDTMLTHIRDIVRATPLPVNADFQNGFADDPDEVAQNVKLCVATGVAGLSIEDAVGRGSTIYERRLAIERIQAARESIDETGIPVVLTARCESWLVGHKDPFDTAMDRLVAYAEAGADCLFAPGVRDPDQISAIVKAVYPKPLNVIMSSHVPGLDVSRLADLGVRRISVGSALARMAWGAFMKAANDIAKRGSFEQLATAASFAELNEVFGHRCL
jgi:2-methylisocitrate lyase-like PEP mutase family enzyme